MKKLKIVVISDWFSEKMGYAENFLPKALAQLGHDVHVITSTAQVYYSSADYNKTYKPFLGNNIVNDGISKVDGYVLHRLKLIPNSVGMPGIRGLDDYLVKIKPQIIQTLAINSVTTKIAAKYCQKNNCKLFTECHIHASVFKKKNFFKKGLSKIITKCNIFNIVLDFLKFRLNRRQLNFINSLTEICYPIARDVAKIAINNFYVPENKIKIQSLGVDTQLFYPANDFFINNKKSIIRKELGINDDSLLCIYTGRFTRDKNPQCLAKAINYLQNQKEDIQAIFIGRGDEREAEEISSMKGCLVHDFVQAEELNKFYWISDIGIWPNQESTSQLDAAACGLPIILSDSIEVVERVSGNGFLYKNNNEIDLAEKIKILKDPVLRSKMSKIGSEKIKNNYSWTSIATEREKDYYKSLENKI